jgi:8-amino-7-oxononanoate synthase
MFNQEATDLFKKARETNKRSSLERFKPEHIALGMRKVDSLGPGVVYNGGRKMLMLSSNNYLGLSGHPKVLECGARAVMDWGTSTSGSRLLNGTNELHLELEAMLAKFKKVESVAVFSSGYMANLGVVSALVSRDDVVILDKLAHASIIDGCQLAGAVVRTFKHQDMNSLEHVLQSIPDGKAKLVVVDGVYSMDGDFAVLPDIVRVAHQYGARVLVDDAHGTGVAGPTGRGTAEHFGMEEPDIITGTLSKALGCIGGFVAARAEVINYIKCTARSFIFSTSLSPSATASLLTAMCVMQSEPERRENLWKCTNHLHSGLKQLGFNTGNSETPIIPVILNDETLMFEMVAALDRDGIFASPVAYPAVPKNKPRVRISLMSDHCIDDMDRLLESLERNANRLSIFDRDQDKLCSGYLHDYIAQPVAG